MSNLKRQLKDFAEVVFTMVFGTMQVMKPVFQETPKDWWNHKRGR
jgi:hypothetical protein